MSSRARSGSGIKQPHVHERVDKKASAAFHLTPSASSAALLDPGGKTDHRFRQFLYDFSTLGASLEIVRSYLA
jgi:DNA-binding MarR family transcriptional regulator